MIELFIGLAVTMETNDYRSRMLCEKLSANCWQKNAQQCTTGSYLLWHLGVLALRPNVKKFKMGHFDQYGLEHFKV